METRTTGSGVHWAIAALCVVLVVFVAGIAACAVLVSSIGKINLNFERRHLHPIPVRAEACPYINRARPVVADLSDLWQERLYPPPPRKQLLPKLDALVLLLTAATPHVPPRIGTEFRHVIEQSRIGRRALARHPKGNYLQPLLDGVSALADASDLIGSACGAALYSGFAL